MRIVMLGNHQVPYSSESHHAHTLEQLGHDVTRIQEGSHGDLVVQRTLGADLFVWVHSHGAPPTCMVPISLVLSHFRRHRIPMLTYHLDLYWGIPSRFSEYQNHPFMTDLDYFFSVDPPLVEWLNTHTATKGRYLTAGVLEDECYLGDKDNVEPYPVIFVGSYQYHSEWSYRPQLIDWLKTAYGDAFTGWGPAFPGGLIRGDDLNRLYANTKVVVGDTFSPGFDYPGYFSDRAFETLGRGGFLIHPRIKGIEDHFQDGVHLVLYEYNNFDQLREKIDYYLTHDAEREAIRIAGHQHVRAHHTYTHRWKHILETVKGP
jgi:hypothetical protein